MDTELFSYLTKLKARNLEKLLPGLTRVNEKFRFDSERYDILASCHGEFIGIKEIAPDMQGLQKIIADAEWIKRFNGKSLVLVSEQRLPYAEMVKHDNIIIKYYKPEIKGYSFFDTPEDKIAEAGKKGAEIVGKMLAHPLMVNYFLGKASKHSEAFRVAKIAYNVYKKVRK